MQAGSVMDSCRRTSWADDRKLANQGRRALATAGRKRRRFDARARLHEVLEDICGRSELHPTILPQRHKDCSTLCTT